LIINASGLISFIFCGLILYYFYFYDFYDTTVSLCVDQTLSLNNKNDLIIPVHNWLYTFRYPAVF
jgi:hypothetical protein